MQAARLIRPGEPLIVDSVPEPEIRPGGVKVEVMAAAVASYAGRVMGGVLPIPLPVPYVPGPSCIGRVVETSSDVTGIAPGEIVFCSPYYSEGVLGGRQESILIGWFGLTPGSGRLLERWRDGAFAQRAVYPAACVTPLGPGTGREHIKLGGLAIAYGGLLRAEFEPGQALLVNGATGNLGSCAVLTALSMGASRVVAVGRNPVVLSQLAELDRRVVARPMDAAEELEPVDAVLDVLGYVTDPQPVGQALAHLRPGGTAVFLGGVLTDIPISYLTMLTSQWTLRGSFMYPPGAVAHLARMVRSGTLDLGRIRAVGYPLDQANEAVAAAAQLRGLQVCFLQP